MNRCRTHRRRFRFPSVAVAARILILAGTLGGPGASRLLSAADIPVSGDVPAGIGRFPSAQEIEQVLGENAAWLSDADRLMEELNALDVRMYTLINRAGGEHARNRLIRERSNIRRLMVELTEARNRVYLRQDAYRRMEEDLHRSRDLHRPEEPGGS